MTTIDDRLTKLEDGHASLSSMFERVIGVLEVQASLIGTIRETQAQVLELLGQMQETQQAIVAKLNEHSSDLTLIKKYLG